jgi:PAS domain-containing protein
MDNNEQIKAGEDDLKDSVLELEKEIRARSEHMMSSAASRRFIGDILNVVTSFSDRVKAYRIAETFVQDETSLKKTEQLIKNLAAGSEPGDQLLTRLRDEIVSRGMGEEDLKKLLEKTRRKPKAKPRRRKKSYDQALYDGIQQRVRALGLDGEKHKEAVERLATFFQNKLKEREIEFNREKKHLAGSVAKREKFIDKIAKSGVLIWDTVGKIEYVSIRAADFLELKPGDQLRREVLEEISEGDFPLQQVDAEALQKVGLSAVESRLLISIDTVVTDEAGKPVGVLTRAQ